jgi:NAD(P)-dependent dehydrogenase (short-subunit alcohol dehydrogenase family)
MPDRTAVVSGAARGIGAAIAARLANDGWRVVALDRENAGEVPGVRFRRCDVSREDEVASAIEEVGTTEGRLDALICNAGFGINKKLSALTLEEWNSVLATNLTSIFLLVRAAETLLRSAKGAVVTIASTRAHMSEPDTVAYSASKGGVVALTHALAVSLGPDVRVNCISPGWINSRGAAISAADHAQHPAGRVGVPADIAAMVAFLVGPEAGFITGAEFVVDGGMTRKMIYLE